MKTFFTLLALVLTAPVFAQTPTETYPSDPDSQPQPGVPKGEVLKFTFENSKIFPGTWREYWVYVPAQYRPEQPGGASPGGSSPACVYVNQDGIQWNAPVVFDNLIHKKQMPVTIGVFVAPGRVRAANPDAALDRFNRSFEYDGLGDAYARFLLEELLPEVEKQKTSDGRAIRLSPNGNDRAIGGSSSGAICAFTAAWERPAAFSRVFSTIGTYVGLRGGDRYHTLVRKYEPRPIRVFLQDGSNDLNIYGGDWWMANQTLERALSFAGYETRHVWGEGAHNGKHGTALFPEAMKFLWENWPQPVKAGPSKNQTLSDILLPGEDWQLVGEGYAFTEGCAANAQGEVFYQDIPASKTYKVGLDGKLTVLGLDAKKASGTAFGADGSRYVVAGETKQVLRYDAAEKETVVADNQPGNDLVVAHNGNVYLTAPDGQLNPSKLFLIRPNGEKVAVDEGATPPVSNPPRVAMPGLKFANGLCLSPDQTQLYVTESASHWVWVYQVQPDGTLAHKQRYGYLHVPDTAENAWPDGLRCDRAGRVYVASRVGIQVLDQLGRVQAILPTPNGAASNVCFGGKNFDTLYVTANQKVYRRKLNVQGANAWATPTKPTAPKL